MNDPVPQTATNAVIYAGMITSINLRYRKPPHKADEVVQNKDDSRQLESLVLTFLIAVLLRFPSPLVKIRQRSRNRCRKIDTRDSYENWPDKMAKKPILDLLPRSMEFHNLSHVNLTDTQSRFPRLGFKFQPTLRPPNARVFDCQVQDFCRSVRLKYEHANQPDDPDFNPKLYVKIRLESSMGRS